MTIHAWPDPTTSEIPSGRLVRCCMARVGELPEADELAHSSGADVTCSGARRGLDRQRDQLRRLGSPHPSIVLRPRIPNDVED